MTQQELETEIRTRAAKKGVPLTHPRSNPNLFALYFWLAWKRRLTSAQFTTFQRLSVNDLDLLVLPSNRRFILGGSGKRTGGLSCFGLTRDRHALMFVVSA